jgi:hypothetical protein
VTSLVVVSVTVTVSTPWRGVVSATVEYSCEVESASDMLDSGSSSQKSSSSLAVAVVEVRVAARIVDVDVVVVIPSDMVFAPWSVLARSPISVARDSITPLVSSSE